MSEIQDERTRPFDAIKKLREKEEKVSSIQYGREFYQELRGDLRNRRQFLAGSYGNDYTEYDIERFEDKQQETKRLIKSVENFQGRLCDLLMPGDRDVKAEQLSGNLSQLEGSSIPEYGEKLSEYAVKVEHDIGEILHTGDLPKSWYSFMAERIKSFDD